VSLNRKTSGAPLYLAIDRTGTGGSALSSGSCMRPEVTCARDWMRARRVSDNGSRRNARHCSPALREFK
jgi:hypothetical protein